MQYSTSSPFRGDTGKAFGLAEPALTAIGFRLTERTANSIEFIGPGMNSTRESPLVGASRIHIRNESGKLELAAELGGVQRMSRFVTYFPIGLVLFLGIVLAAVFGIVFGQGMWTVGLWAAVGINALIWLILGPMVTRHIRKRTDHALDPLLANMVAVGESA
jgi:hypothetical protein